MLEEGRPPKCGELGVEEVERWARWGDISKAPVDEWDGGDSPPDTERALMTDVADMLCVSVPAVSDCSGELDMFTLVVSSFTVYGLDVK